MVAAISFHHHEEAQAEVDCAECCSGRTHHGHLAQDFELSDCPLCEFFGAVYVPQTAENSLSSNTDFRIVGAPIISQILFETYGISLSRAPPAS